MQGRLGERQRQRRLLEHALGLFPAGLVELGILGDLVKIVPQGTLALFFADDGGVGDDGRVILKNKALPAFSKLHHNACSFCIRWG